VLTDFFEASPNGGVIALEDAEAVLVAMRENSGDPGDRVLLSTYNKDLGKFSISEGMCLRADVDDGTHGSASWGFNEHLGSRVESTGQALC